MNIKKSIQRLESQNKSYLNNLVIDLATGKSNLENDSEKVKPDTLVIDILHNQYCYYIDDKGCKTDFIKH